MYTFKYESHNHRCTIMDDAGKRGVTLGNVGEETAKFLKELVFKVNKIDFDEVDPSKITPLSTVFFIYTGDTAEHALYEMLENVGRESFVAGVKKVLEGYEEPVLSPKEGGETHESRYDI